ncbi:hypothetical protein PACTADRAFT_82752 [Pachysolen tannophilus NRRL Y-2460]|uniref:Autophagy-related protein 11 n=1 Tax=Pachysolen tannophilus NRRL Y-2460 TaxID=669874 RepID=A0A1E4TNV7_PACTA|nr:hypothetical protein PACTADRAFT_82752 [Pachysolen tannophilus NRRL Y-2460]
MSIAQSSLPSLTIYNSLTGAKVVVSSYKFNTLDSLKEYISGVFGIPRGMLFILTPFGIKLKFSMLLHDQVSELYVFDRKIFNLNNNNDGKINGNEAVMSELKKLDPISLLKPMESPLSSMEFDSSENLRSVLNVLKRNSGWAAALLSDFKKTRDGGRDEFLQDSINIILISLNVLIQYLSLSFKTLEKNFNNSIDQLIILQENSLNQSWELHYNKLNNISFISSNGLKISLSDLIDKRELSHCSKSSMKLMNEINELLLSLRKQIDTGIIKERNELSGDYKLLQKNYAYNVDKKKINTNDNDINIDIDIDIKDDGKPSKLETLVTTIINETNNLLTCEQFEKLSSSNKNSYNQELNKLHQIFIKHKELIIEIYSISNELYLEKLNKSSKKLILQEKLITEFFTKITKIQINLITVGKQITNELSLKLDELRHYEINLSIVLDLPLIFGLLIVQFYRKKKWDKNFEKIFFKTNEIFEMLKFMEISNREKWIDKFYKNNLNDSLLLVNLNMESFVNEEISNVKIMLLDKKNENNKQLKIDTTLQRINNNNNSSNKLNKLISTISDAYLQQKSNTITNLQSFWSTLDVSSIDQLKNYISKLVENDIDPKIIKKLEKNIIDLNNEGRFDIDDLNFIKFYKKFIKCYEIEGLNIEIHAKGDQKILENNISESNSYLKDTNNELINGYEARIKKLENLLHQQQYLKFNQHWSNNGQQRLHEDKFNEFNSKIESLSYENSQLMKQIEALRQELNEAKLNNDLKDQEITRLKDISPSKDDEKLAEIENNNTDKLMIDQLNKEKLSLIVDLENSRTKISSLEKDNAELIASNSSKNDELRVRIKELEAENQKLVDQNAELTENNAELNTMKTDLLENMSSLTKNYNFENSNNLNKINELNLNIDSLLAEQDCLNKELIKKQESLNDKETVIVKLCLIIDSMYSKLKALSQFLFIDLSIFCLILENIGLLLVKENQPLNGNGDVNNGADVEKDAVVKIIRVKGLRNKKRLNQQAQILDNTMDEIQSDNEQQSKEVSSSVVHDAEKYLYWTDLSIENETCSVKEMVRDSIDSLDGNYHMGSNNIDADHVDDADQENNTDHNNDINEEVHQADEQDEDSITELDIHSKSLIHKFYNKSSNLEINYENFLKTCCLFTSTANTGLLVNSISKRFKDVENLARKLFKENAKLASSKQALVNLSKYKISIKNFSVDDLVLFLPTRDDFIHNNTNNENDNINGDGKTGKVTNKEQQPWAAFNIGAPHFFLKNDKYISSKKKALAPQQDPSSSSTSLSSSILEESLVKNENYVDLTNRDWLLARIIKIKEYKVDNNSENNPFKLSNGINWYFVEAKEETLENIV